MDSENASLRAELASVKQVMIDFHQKDTFNGTFRSVDNGYILSVNGYMDGNYFNSEHVFDTAYALSEKIRGMLDGSV